MIRVFHCRQNEYFELKDRLSKKWILCNWLFSRGEWHITGISRDFFERLPQERRERIMTRLAYTGKENLHAKNEQS